MKRLAVVLLVGCSSRFSSLHSGTYTCAATVTANDCGVTVSPSTMPVTLEGGGTDEIGLLAPSSGVILDPSAGWSSIEFGSQSDPMSYVIHESASCANGSVDDTETARLVTLGSDHLVVDVTFAYTGLTQCGTTTFSKSTCTIAYAMTCDR